MYLVAESDRLAAFPLIPEKRQTRVRPIFHIWHTGIIWQYLKIR